MNFITSTLKLKDIDPKLADKVAKDYQFDVDDVQLIRKGLVAEDLKFSEGERACISYITTAAKDRDNEVVDPTGAILTDYRKHPVVLFGHKYDQLPIGRNEWIKADGKGLIAKTVYANHDEAEKVYQYRKDGFPLATSIGFVPLTWEDFDVSKSAENKDGVKRKYTKWLLLEYSDVPVPSNPEALTIAMSKGLSVNVEDPLYFVSPTITPKDAANAPASADHDEAVTPPAEVVTPDEVITDPPHPITEQEPDPPDETPGQLSVNKYAEIKKALDPSRHMSVDDIKDAICVSLNTIYPGCVLSRKIDCYPNGSTVVEIEDLFPFNYPSGNVIIKVKMNGEENLYIIPYVIDAAGSAVLGDKVEVEEAYVTVGKDIAKFQKIIDKYFIKEGRVLSTKNRELIQNCITSMTEAIDMLDDLVVATEPSPKAETDTVVKDADGDPAETHSDEIVVESDVDTDAINIEIEDAVSTPENVIDLDAIETAQTKEVSFTVDKDTLVSVVKGVSGEFLKNFSPEKLNDILETAIRRAQGRVY